MHAYMCNNLVVVAIVEVVPIVKQLTLFLFHDDFFSSSKLTKRMKTNCVTLLKRWGAAICILCSILCIVKSQCQDMQKKQASRPDKQEKFK